MSSNGTRLTPAQGWVLALTSAASLVAARAARGHYATPATFVAGFGPAMAACAGLALLGAAAGLIIPGRKAAPASPVPVQIHAPKIESRR